MRVIGNAICLLLDSILFNPEMHMADKNAGSNWQSSVITLTNTVLTISVLAALYFLREVFIPLALAIFFAFVFNPVFRQLQRWRIPKQLAVVIVVVSTMIGVGTGGWILSRQVSNLVAELPSYSDHISSKLAVLRDMTVGSEQWNQFIEEMNGVLHRDQAKASAKVDGENKVQGPTTPPRVIVEEPTPRWLSWVSAHATGAIGTLTQLLLALVLVIFILLDRDDLLNRLLRLVGKHNASFTSKAVLEAGNKMSQFLLTQLIVNSVFGLILAMVLLIIGVKYALLWGFLAAVLRYIPYLGPLLAAVFPVTMSLAQFEGWLQPGLVLGSFLIMEIILSNLIEPLLYGKNIGVSGVALLLAAAFWTWMWGAVGLVLSTPLTLVLVTIGKYVSQLNYLTVVLGDEPVLSDHMNFYQRLLGGDQDEVERLIRGRMLEKEPRYVFDDMLIPALHHLKVDSRRRIIDESDKEEMLRSIREILEESASDINFASSSEGMPGKQTHAKTSFHVLAIPAREEADQLSMEMLKLLLDEQKWEMEIVQHEMLSSEALQKVAEGEIKAVCLGGVSPGSMVHTRYLCKRMRVQFPDLKILVGIWGTSSVDEDKIKMVQEAGADWVGSSLLEARDQLQVWYSIWLQQTASKVA